MSILELNLATELSFLRSESESVSLIIGEALEDQEAASDALKIVHKLEAYISETKENIADAQASVRITDALDTIVSLYETNIDYATDLVEKAKADPLYAVALDVQTYEGAANAREAKAFYAAFEQWLIDKRSNLGKLCNSVTGRLRELKGQERTSQWEVVYRQLIDDFVADEFPESIRFQVKETHAARVARACKEGKEERHEFLMVKNENYRKEHEEKAWRRAEREKERTTRRQFDNTDDAEEYMEGGEVASMKFGIEDSPRRQKANANEGTSKQGIERGLSDDDMVADSQ